MISKSIRLIILAAILAGGSAAHAQGKKLSVLTTTTILQDFARNVAGDNADVSSIVPPDGDVHDYQPTTDDVKRIAQADLVFVNGVGLEGFIDRLIADSGTKAKIVTSSEGIGIRSLSGSTQNPPNLPPGIVGLSGTYDCSGTNSDCDPHLWQDPTNVILYVLNIRDAFIAVDPDHAAAYKANAAVYITQLQQLDADMWLGLSKIPDKNRVLVTNHDALGYFAAHFRFTLVGVVLPRTTDEPTPKQLAQLVDQIKSQGIPAIFTENVQNRKLIDEIANQTGVKVAPPLYTDALGASGTPGETYIGMMRANLKVISDALGGS